MDGKKRGEGLALKEGDLREQSDLPSFGNFASPTFGIPNLFIEGNANWQSLPDLVNFTSVNMSLELQYIEQIMLSI